MREVRVVGADGAQLGVMPIQQALETARQQELDLVEVAPEAQPPVCRIMDFGKYKYTQARRLKEARKKQTTILVKEVKMGPKTEKHDFDFKLRHVRRFIEEGHKAKVTVRSRGARWRTRSWVGRCSTRWSKRRKISRSRTTTPGWRGACSTSS